MNFDDERAALAKLLSDNWTATPVAWPNRAFTPPDDARWIAFNILNGDTFQSSLGVGGMTRVIGVVSIQIFVPADDGEAQARKLADLLVPIFRRVQTSHGSSGQIKLRDPQLVPIGKRDGRYQMNLNIPFMRDTA